MDLIPASASAASAPGVVLGEAGRRVARVETAALRRGDAQVEVRTVGRFEFDEQRLGRLTAWIGGRIEKVHVPYVGATVVAGEPLVDLYAPDLLVLREELRAATAGTGLGAEIQTKLCVALFERLARHGLTEEQVRRLVESPLPSARFTLQAPFGGIVVERLAQPGTYVQEGELLMRVAALDPIALDVELYEREIAFISVGDHAEIEVDALPEQRFEGSVAYLMPSLTEATRTVRARLIVPNPQSIARPGMFARARFHVSIAADGRPASNTTSILGSMPAAFSSSHPATSRSERVVYDCPMHPEVRQLGPGRCSRCRMTLVLSADQLWTESRPSDRKALLLPASALLDLGERRLVYVERSEGRYEPIEVRLGPRVGDAYVVLSGLAEDDRVVVRGAFLIDSQTQIEGKPSLLFSDGAGAKGVLGSHSEHAGHGMEAQRK